MIFNVAQLLKSDIGATQTMALDDSDHLQLDETDAELAGPVTGQVRLHRTNQGIFVNGTVRMPVRLECARCLRPFEREVSFTLRETFYPTIDVNTGVPVPHTREEDEDGFPIDAHHEIDLREPIRQALMTNLPISALHAEDCKGLCPHCGKDLNDGPCDCVEEQTDGRFDALRALLDAPEATEA